MPGAREAPRPEGRGFPVRYIPFILCPFLPAGRQGPPPKGPGLRGALAGQLICLSVNDLVASQFKARTSLILLA